MLSRLKTLIVKELQAQLRDRDSRRMLILPVILQIVFFPFAATLEVQNTHIAIFDQDAGAHSIELTQRFAASSAFTHIKLLSGMGAITNNLDNQHVLLAIHFPSDFSRKIEAGRTATLQTLIDGRRSNSAQIAAGYVEDIVNTYQNELLQSQPIVKNHVPSKITVQNWFNPNLDYKWFLLPTFIVLITTLGCLIVTAMSVAREREQGTFEQLLVSPLTPGYIMIGKTIPALIVVLIQSSIILFASIVFYRIPFQGSLLLLYVCILCYGLVMAGIGLSISSICYTQQQAFLGVFGFVVPALLLSGFIAPVENIPQPLRAVSWFDPLQHFLVISKGIYLKGFGIDLVWHDLWPLILIGVMSLSLAYFRFKRYAQ